MSVPAEAPLLVWDCDGVLVDSEYLVVVIESEMLTDVGIRLTPDEVAQRYVGLSEASMAASIHKEFSVELPEGFAAEKARRIESVFEAQLEPVAGIPDLLVSLAGPRCVASSSRPERIESSLRTTGLYELLAPHLFSATMVEQGKPAPDLFLHAASTLGREPHDCIVVEDSPAGVAAALAAAMAVIGFTAARHCSPDHTERLRGAGASAIATTADELAQALADLGAG